MTSQSVLLYVMIAGAVLNAGTVSNPVITLPGGASTLGATDSANNLNLGNGNLLTQTTACFDGQCVIPSTGATNIGNVISNFTVSDPLTLRVTESTITCTNTGTACGIAIPAWSFQFTLPTTTTFSVTFALDGTAPANFAGLQARGFLNGGPLPALQTIPVDGGGNFSQSFNLGAATIISNKATLELDISGLGAGQSINLPNSMTLVLNPAPEPSTLGVAGLGLLALGALAMRRRQKA